ncbi:MULTISPECIES: hypothetical protein [unclassified Streptomyces]|uniref:hypothetical protein n=1 Tax=unclassified Streptomyces TaxID=2593676 RepID=UPI00131C2023|nr:MULTISPECIES: hypothetical protein [unclassified Streptomyces]MYX20309.1 hypothetical protein [Streptomyces sp. SID8380]
MGVPLRRAGEESAERAVAAYPYRFFGVAWCRLRKEWSIIRQRLRRWLRCLLRRLMNRRKEVAVRIAVVMAEAVALEVARVLAAAVVPG